MAIRVEFYGIARQRAGVASREVNLHPGDSTLGDVLAQAAAEVLAGGQLAPALAVNLDGQRFVTDLATPVRDGQSVLVLSADAGG